MTGDVNAELAGLMLAALDVAPLKPPSGLWTSVLEEAQRRRPRGRWCEPVESIGPMDAFRQANERLARLLGDLLDAEWAVPARRGWTVKDVVAHLVGADEYTGAVLGLWPPTRPEAGPSHVEATAPAMQQLAPADPASVVRRWRVGVDALLGHTAELTCRRAQVVDFYGGRLTVDDVLTVRAFEVWAHTEDIAAAVGGRIEPPEPSRLALMTDLAIRLLPLGIDLSGQQPRPSTARLVLTGAGGGTWDVPLNDQAAPGVLDVVVVLDVVEFCRHAAHGHLRAECLDGVEGDLGLVEPLLAGAAAFAE